MAIINITPVMTSLTTPSPYVVTYSSQYNDDGYASWRVFYPEENVNGWAVMPLLSENYVQLDFSKNTKVSGLTIQGRKYNSNDLTAYPKDMKIQGSFDGVTFVDIMEFESKQPTVLGEKFTYMFKNTVNYRYYRVIAYNTWGNVMLIIGNIEFLHDEDLPMQGDENLNVSHKNASLVYTLPMATTEKIKAKSSDSRVGLLGMANDDENFGDLYVVGKDGKSHLTKSGIKSEILFDGCANVAGTSYKLADSIEKFSYLIINGRCENGSNKLYSIETVITKENYDYTSTSSTYVITGTSFANSGTGYTIGFGLEDENTLYVNSITSTQSTWSNIHICRVIGVY